MVKNRLISNNICKNAHIISQKGFEQVTCGSTLKLTNKANNFKLHSHGVTYGNDMYRIPYIHHGLTC